VPLGGYRGFIYGFAYMNKLDNRSVRVSSDNPQWTNWVCPFNLLHTAITWHQFFTVSLWAQNSPCHRPLLHRKTVICETVNIILSFQPRPVSYETVISYNECYTW